MPTRRVSRADENSCSTTTARALTGNKPSAGWPRRRLTQPHRRHAPAMARVRRIVPDQIKIEGLVVQQSHPLNQSSRHTRSRPAWGTASSWRSDQLNPARLTKKSCLAFTWPNHKLLVGNNRVAKKNLNKQELPHWRTVVVPKLRSRPVSGIPRRTHPHQFDGVARPAPTPTSPHPRRIPAEVHTVDPVHPHRRTRARSIRHAYHRNPYPPHD
jgi:hypothetical protein